MNSSFFHEWTIHLLILSVCSCGVFGQLTLTTAGMLSKGILRLSAKTVHVICIEDYPEGLNVRCDGGVSDTYAQFSLNGRKFRTERVMPYYLAGDVNGVPEEWLDVPNESTIICITQSVTYRATIRFLCESTSSTPTPFPTISPFPSLLPGMMYAVAAGRKAATVAVMINNGSRICAQEELNTKKFSVVCGGDSSVKWVRFVVNGVIVQQDRKEPYSITKNWSPRKFQPWREAPLKPFYIACILSNGFQNVVSDVEFTCLKT